MSIFLNMNHLKYNFRLFTKYLFKHSSSKFLFNETWLAHNIFTSKFASQISSNNLLYTVLQLQNKNISNSIIDNHINKLCINYKNLNSDQKRDFLLEVACKYGVHHDNIHNLACTLVSDNCNECQLVRIQDKLKAALTPQYKWLFIHVGRQENGVKFLVDMRTDVLELLQILNISTSNMIHLQQLSNTLRELFLLWFSVGFLKLERITWKSSCEMLQKISDYEAVHPVRNWPDLKKRMGSDRRCFVYTHSSMPDEPLVILHTALRNEIASSTAGIITQDIDSVANHISNPNELKAAIFYSISSTQKGLQGIELGNYIIKRVATEIAKEFPQIDQFSTLSPIPKFKNWLFDSLNCAKNDSVFARNIFTETEINKLKSILKSENIYKEMMKHLNTNSWLQISQLATALEPILMKMCARYLYLEKKRGYALDDVANFHLRNGAEMWRINWMADLTARGLTTSCGIMVNYRYYLDQTDNNSQQYIENKQIAMSPIVQELLKKYNMFQ